MATNDKRTLLTEVPKVGVYPDKETFDRLEPERQKRDKQLITDAVADTKSSRDKAIENAHNALVDAFGPKLNSKIVEKLTQESLEIAENDIEELLKELDGAPEDDEMVQECRRRLNEAKDPSVPSSEKERMYRDIHRKFWAYAQSLPSKDFTKDPKKLSETDQAVKKFMENRTGPIQWISYEGSIIISSLLGVSENDGAYISLTQLPEDDRERISTITRGKVTTRFWVEFDNYKNFHCVADDGNVKDGLKFALGNRMVSTPPNESSRFGNIDVKVEKKGKDIVIGDRIKLERHKIQEVIKSDSNMSLPQSKSGFQPRTKVAGRNAYEIRADVLEMALDWVKSQNDKTMDSEDILDVAESFYSFVEHK